MRDSNSSLPNNLQHLPLSIPKKEITRKAVIETGLQALETYGAVNICKVCIHHGGSCCNGCSHLVNYAGCQLRNTSCTAWLCGFLKFLLYEAGLLEDWAAYWEQVPGLAFREDYTPEHFAITHDLPLRDLNRLSQALAADLGELVRKKKQAGYILQLREQLDIQIDQLEVFKDDPKRQKRIRKRIQKLAAPFERFHRELIDYRL